MKRKIKVTVWLKKPWFLFLSTRYPESNLPSLSLCEELASDLDLQDFQSLIKLKETSWLLIRTLRWKSESKTMPNSLQLVSLPPAVCLPSTFHTATRLNLKTSWLCHSHSSTSCNNILKLQLKYKPCLLTLSFSLFHEHKTPSSLCVQNAWGNLCSCPKPPQTPPVLGDLCGSAQRIPGSPLLCPPRLRRALIVKGNAEWQSVNGSLKSWCLTLLSELTFLTSVGPQHNSITPH